jgi:hypothetical protein
VCETTIRAGRQDSESLVLRDQAVARGGGDTAAGCAERVAKGQGAAPEVGLVHIEATDLLTTGETILGELLLINIKWGFKFGRKETKRGGKVSFKWDIFQPPAVQQEQENNSPGYAGLLNVPCRSRVRPCWRAPGRRRPRGTQ